MDLILNKGKVLNFPMVRIAMRLFRREAIVTGWK
jgi:hypothetical protein